MTQVTLHVCLLVLTGASSLFAYPGYMHDHYGSYDSPDYAVVRGSGGRSKFVQLRDRPDYNIAYTQGSNGQRKLVKIYDRPDPADKDYAVVRGSGGRSRLVQLRDRPDYNLAFVRGSNGKRQVVKIYDRPDPADKVLLPVGTGKNKRYMVADRDQLYDSHMYHGLGGRHGAYTHGRKKRHALFGMRRFPFFSPMFPHPAVAMALQAHRAKALYHGALFGRRFGVPSARRTVRQRKIKAKAAAPVQTAAPAQKLAPVAPAPAQVARASVAPAVTPMGYNEPMSQIVDNYGSLSTGPDSYIGSTIDNQAGLQDFNDPNSYVYQDNMVGGLDLGANVDYQVLGSNNLGGNVYDAYDMAGTGNINSVAGTGNMNTVTGTGNLDNYVGTGGLDTYTGTGGFDNFPGTVNPNEVFVDRPANNGIYSDTVGGAFDYQNNGNILTSGVNVYANDVANTMYDVQGNIAFNAGGNPGSNLGSIVNVDAIPI